MTFLEIIEAIVVEPVKLVLELIFNSINLSVGNPIAAIALFSLAVNIITLPLYNRAEIVQKRVAAEEKRLEYGIKHIKKTYRGDERFMMLQTYYRQNGYSPLNSIKGATSLFLEIPFFIAAYRLISGLTFINGTSFGPISDLGQPDGMITLGGFTINVMPVIMTAINAISSAIYLKDSSVKEKVRTYGLAVFFLILLYSSPACLVFYWTMNNLFSLFKNIFTRINKNDFRGLYKKLSVLGISFLVVFSIITAMSDKEAFGTGSLVFVLASSIILCLPYLYTRHKSSSRLYTPNGKVVIITGAFLTVLIGLLIPSATIAASPQDFVLTFDNFTPLWYVGSALCISFGTFMLWLPLIYSLTRDRTKVYIERALVAFSFVAAIGYFVFGKNKAILSPDFKFDVGLCYDTLEIIINTIVIVAIIVLALIISKKKSAISICLAAATIAITGMSAVNFAETENGLANNGGKIDASPHITLSKTEKNVVVIMLDRASGLYLPYILEEKPELKEKLDGFTYYSNVLSFGAHTTLAAPALLGGYEYAPAEINKRDNETLVDKHNEALKVMPVMFDREGFDVTVCDPPFSNYRVIPDLTIYDEYSDIKTYNTMGAFTGESYRETAIKNRKRNAFCYSLMKTLPKLIQPLLYNNGTYFDCSTWGTQDNISFLNSYNVLLNLPSMTYITEGKGCFLFFGNETTHYPTELQEPDYTPLSIVNNSNTDRFKDEDVRIDIMHYHVNMASYLQIGKWLDYLRENNIYDNTRIIITSDHGVFSADEVEPNGQVVTFEESNNNLENVTSGYMPILMVKDFNARGFTVNDEFMTNADVPYIAMNGILSDMTNPFTGSKISEQDKSEQEFLVTLSHDFAQLNHFDTVFSKSDWAYVKSDVHDISNWRLATE